MTLLMTMRKIPSCMNIRSVRTLSVLQVVRRNYGAALPRPVRVASNSNVCLSDHALLGVKLEDTRVRNNPWILCDYDIAGSQQRSLSYHSYLGTVRVPVPVQQLSIRHMNSQQEDKRRLIWEKMLNEFIAYRDTNGGDVNVPKHYPPNRRLGRWVDTVRQNYRYFQMGKPSMLDKDRIQTLEEEGFIWNFFQESWNLRFEELKEYKELHGTAYVPTTEEFKELRTWVSHQRQNYVKKMQGEPSSMTDTKMKQLKDIGFIFDQHQENWNLRLSEFIAYREANGGDTRVPTDYPPNPKLGTWVDSVRQNYRFFQMGETSMLDKDRIQVLEEEGFIWNTKEDTWNLRFEELKEFKRYHGDCLVPTKHSNKKLAKWVDKQRIQYKKLQLGEHSHLTPERKETLEKIGFVWNVNDHKWNVKCEELKNFITMNGHCNIPTKGNNRALRSWANRQRTEYNKFIEGEKSYLDDNRVELLRRAGFNFA